MRQAGEHSSLPPVHSGVRFRWVLVAPDSNIALTFPCAGDIAGRLHAHQGIHLNADGLLDTQSHFAGAAGVAVEQVRQRRALYAKHSCRGDHGEAERHDDFGADEVVRVRRIHHAHGGCPCIGMSLAVDLPRTVLTDVARPV